MRLAVIHELGNALNELVAAQRREDFLERNDALLVRYVHIEALAQHSDQSGPVRGELANVDDEVSARIYAKRAPLT